MGVTGECNCYLIFTHTIYTKKTKEEHSLTSYGRHLQNNYLILLGRYIQKKDKRGKLVNFLWASSTKQLSDITHTRYTKKDKTEKLVNFLWASSTKQLSDFYSHDIYKKRQKRNTR